MNDPTEKSDAPALALDLSAGKRFATFVRGDITVILTWLQHNSRACMVLIPTYRITHFDRITPCIIPMDNAWAWAEETGDGMHAATMSFQFACALGLEPTNPKGAFRVTSIIRDYLQDLVTMPPPPPFLQFVAADATIRRQDTGAVKQVEISEDV